MTFKSPYNFVPLSNRVLVRYDSVEQLPPHNRIDPALKSGVIAITMLADTPVMVSGGRRDGSEILRFHKDPLGRHAIPGSTVKGMVRENMQILGFGQFRAGEDMQKRSLMYREIAGANESAAGPLKKHYTAVLGTDPPNKVTIPYNVQGGYIRCTGGDSFEILQTKGEVLRVSAKFQDAVNIVRGRHAIEEPVCYRRSGDKVTGIRKPEEGPLQPGEERGVLLVTGKPVSKDNGYYIFPAADESAEPKPFCGADVLNYRLDYEARENVLKVENGFRKLPKEGETRAFFYVEYEGHLYPSRSRFPRIAYKYALEEGLPAVHEAEELVLDMPHAILGYADADSKSAYRSRVSFGDLIAVNPAEDKLVSLVLAEPKPSFYAGYSTDGKHYNEDGFTIRGRKQYWLKAPVESAVGGGNDKIASKFVPLKKGTCFTGEIRFKNLHEDELGLLLWSLRLDEGCYQPLGLAKPYGYGRMKLTIDSLREEKAEVPCTVESFCTPYTVAGNDAIERCIAAYDAFACEQLGVKDTLRKCEELKTFFYIRSVIRTDETTDYPVLQEFKNAEVVETIGDRMREEVRIMKAAEKAAKEAEQRKGPEQVWKQVLESIPENYRQWLQDCTVIGQDKKTFTLRCTKPMSQKMAAAAGKDIEKALEKITGQKLKLKTIL